MILSPDMESYYFDCQDGDFGHVFRFTLDEDDGVLSLEVRLNYYLPWHKRLVNAVRYVFKLEPLYGGQYDTTLLRPEDYDRLVQLVHKAYAKRLDLKYPALNGSSEKPVLNG